MYLQQLLSFVCRGSDKLKISIPGFAVEGSKRLRLLALAKIFFDMQIVLISSKLLQAVPFWSLTGSHLVLIQFLTPRLPTILRSIAKVVIPRDFSIISMQVFLFVPSFSWQLSIMPSSRRCHHTHYCDPVTSIDSLVPVKKDLNCLWVLQLCNPAFCNKGSHLQVINPMRITHIE